MQTGGDAAPSIAFEVGDLLEMSAPNDRRHGIMVCTDPPIVHLREPISCYVTVWSASDWRLVQPQYQPDAMVDPNIVERVRMYREHAMNASASQVAQ